MADYQLFHGDCLQIMPTLEAGSVDLILADLPYGTTQAAWDCPIPLDQLWGEYKRVLKPTGAVVLTASQPFTSQLVMSKLDWFRHSWVWEKSSGTGFFAVERRPLRCHEDVLVFAPQPTTYNPIKTPVKKRVTGSVGGSLAIFGAGTERTKGDNGGESYPRSVIYIPREVHTVHDTQKPVELMEYLIRTYTNEGDVVLDNTMGSGTTGVACQRTDRRFIGIELDAEYFALASERIRNPYHQFRRPKQPKALPAGAVQHSLFD